TPRLTPHPSTTLFRSLDGHRPVVLSGHEYERAADEDRGQPGEDRARPMAVNGVAGDVIEMQRHCHEDEAGERRGASSDHQEKVVPLRRLIGHRRRPSLMGEW